MSTRRIAFFTDSFHEVNGVALTSREFVAFAQRHSLPMLSVRAGPADTVQTEGSITTTEFRRGRCRWVLEKDLAIDVLFLRHKKRIRAALDEFRPDLIHITGPGDAGILGAMLAYELKIPLVASWHTNLHEFGARRLDAFLHFVHNSVRAAVIRRLQQWMLDQCLRFYRLAKVLYAPNPELVELLHRRTGRKTYLMTRGIDVDLFNPNRRERADRDFVIGNVGRLSPEKNIRMLAEVERLLWQNGHTGWRFLIVGDGSERAWLKRNMQCADLPGILRGEDLARAYASMDAFAFPSATDTFGNVVLEAMASGVPAIVTPNGGPKFLVKAGLNGQIAANPSGFAAEIIRLRCDPELLQRMQPVGGLHGWKPLMPVTQWRAVKT